MGRKIAAGVAVLTLERDSLAAEVQQLRAALGRSQKERDDLAESKKVLLDIIEQYREHNVRLTVDVKSAEAKTDGHDERVAQLKDALLQATEENARLKGYVDRVREQEDLFGPQVEIRPAVTMPARVANKQVLTPPDGARMPSLEELRGLGGIGRVQHGLSPEPTRRGWLRL